MTVYHRRLALVVLALGIEGILVLNIIWPIARPADDDGPIWMWVGGLMGFPPAAALLLAYRPSNRLSWALGISAGSAGLIFLMTWYAVTFPDAPFSREIEAVELIPAVAQLAASFALLHLFPSGQFVARWHARVFGVFVALFIGAALLRLVSPGPLEVSGRPNPFGIAPDWAAQIADGSFAMLVPFGLLGIVAVFLRWRRSRGTERAQVKWFVAGALFAMFVLGLAFTTPSSSENEDIIAGPFVILAFWSMPAAIVIAVLRYRLYDIDILINKALVYGSLTALTIAFYLGLVIALSWSVRAISSEQGNELVVAATTLIVAALFQPARRRLQTAVDRRFYRSRYDAARTVEAFQSGLRDQTDIETVRIELAETVNRVLQPASIGVWLARGGRSS